MDSERELAEALFRVRRYLTAKGFDQQADPDHIHAYHNEGKIGPGPAVLRVSDLETLYEYAWRYSDLG